MHDDDDDDSPRATYASNTFLSSCHETAGNKKDSYRQQNVRQRQKLISIIDYDVCMTFY